MTMNEENVTNFLSQEKEEEKEKEKKQQEEEEEEEKQLPDVISTRVRDKVRSWITFSAKFGDVWLPSKAFAFCVRNRPQHPIFDDLFLFESQGVTYEKITKVLNELSKGCQWDYRKGHGVVVYVKDGRICDFYDPVRLIIGNEYVLGTLHRSWKRRIRRIAMEALKEGKNHLFCTGLMNIRQVRSRIENQVQYYKDQFKVRVSSKKQ